MVTCCLLYLSMTQKHSPIEIQNELLESSGQKHPIPLAPLVGHFVDPPNGPRMNRGVDIFEGKLIGRYLPIGGHVPLPEEQDELVLGKLGVHFGKRDHVEGEVPGGILQRHHGTVVVIQTHMHTHTHTEQRSC